MKIKFQKLHPDAVTPSYAKQGDAGLDLTAVSREYNRDSDYVEYDTGIAIELPEGFFGLVVPRSSITKHDHLLRNSVGIIDSGYRGSIKLRFADNLFSTPTAGNLPQYKVGDKIGQLLILPYPQIELQEENNLTDSERGTGGFGSTGN